MMKRAICVVSVGSVLGIGSPKAGHDVLAAQQRAGIYVTTSSGRGKIELSDGTT